MISLALYLAFCAAAIVLVLIPGASVLTGGLLVGRGLGWRWRGDPS